MSNVEAGEVTQGGSTITQQVVKNALLTPEKNLSRKVKEAALALRLEDTMTKKEILERYLNTVYFGNGAYGVQAAAETYWNTTADEAHPRAGDAVLAAVIRNPVNYEPDHAIPKSPRSSGSRRPGACWPRETSPDAEVDAIDAEPLPTRLHRPLPPVERLLRRGGQAPAPS